MPLNAAVHSRPEGRDGEFSTLKELQTEGNANQRNTADHAEQEADDRSTETAADEPDHIAKEFHR